MTDPDPDPPTDPASSLPLRPPRLMRPERDRVELREVCLDSLVAPDHPVRAIWQFVQSCDLDALSASIKAREGHAGRPAIDPAILFALWLWATLDKVATARHIDRLCKRDDTYRWLCGGVGVNYHALSDFRSHRGDWLDAQLTRSVGALISAGVVELATVAQDGMRVRAHAKAASFRRAASLEEALGRAKARVAELAAERAAAVTGAEGGRSRAAKERAARERQQALERAVATMAELQKARDAAGTSSDPGRDGSPEDGGGSGSGGAAPPAPAEPQAKASQKQKGKKTAELRVSSTDPEARVMKMADGGFRPAYNLQFAVDVATRLVVGVDLVNAGSDSAQLVPMHEQLFVRYGRRAGTYLVDGGFTTLAAIQRLSDDGVRVLAPRPASRKEGVDPGARKRGDTDEIAAWRARMDTEQAKLEYRERAATSEWSNAQAREHGLDRFEVVGPEKARAVGLLHALAQHVMGRARLARAGIELSQGAMGAMGACAAMG